jgi:bla regulator protein blaR1
MKFLSSEIIEALGWTLVHASWQATIVALALAIVLFLIRRKSAQIKYFLSFAALLGILLWSGVTFYKSYQYAAEKEALKVQMMSNRNYLSTQLDVFSIETAQPKVKQAPIDLNLKSIKNRAFFQRNFPLICAIWMVGLVVLIARLIAGFIFAKRLRTRSLMPIEDEWHRRLNELATKMGVRRKIEAFFSPLAKVPMTLGALKPIILFPVTAFTGLNSKEIEAIIAHELAHILRNDYLFNIIQSIVEILFFYHPAVWIISSQIRAERENSCDNLAIVATGDKISYMKTLAMFQIQQAQQADLAMAYSAKKGSVLHRIKRLQKEIAMKTNFIEGLIAAGIIVSGLVLASFTARPQVKAAPTDSTQNPSSVAASDTTPLPARDSLYAEMEDLIKRTQASQAEKQQFQKAVEIAMSEPNAQLSAEMMAEINAALTEINVGKIVSEAMKEAAMAMREASIEVERARKEIDRDEIRNEMREARREIEAARKEVERDIRTDMAAEGIDQATIEATVRAATAGLDIAASVVGSIDVQGIVDAALSGVSAALNAVGQIEFDTIHQPVPLSSEQNKKQSDAAQLKKEKKQLEQERKELEKKMKELEKRLERMEN